MMLRFLALTIVLLVLSIFSIKSSKLDFESDYPKLEIKGDNSIIFNDTVISLFSNTFVVHIKADGYLDKTYEGNHSTGISKIKLEKKPIKIDFSQLIQQPSLVLINGSEYSNENATLGEGINEIYLEFKNFLPISREILIDTENYYLFENNLTPISKKIFFLNLLQDDNLILNNSSVLIEDALLLTDFENSITILRGKKSLFDQTITVKNNDTEEILLEKFSKRVQIDFLQNDVDIFLNEKFIGTSTSYLENLSVGDVLTFTKKNFYPEKINYNDQKYLKVGLEPKLGSLLINNKQNAKAELLSKELKAFEEPVELMVGEYDITFTADGYANETRTIIINENKLTEVFLEMLTFKEKAIKESSKNYKNKNGVNFILNNPGKIIIGSDTSEFRRNKNEIKRKVDIKRHFYMSDSLITNKQFNNIMGKSAGDDLPVTNITWIQAATFCNELSKKEGFKPFYIINNFKILGFDISSTGYRLPTEAEWEYVISIPDNDGKKQKIYPWGNSEDLKETIANLSDEESGNRNTILNYYDEHKELAPSKSYPKTALGYYDFLGNAREWVNDFYTEEISLKDNQFIEDYLGPNFGKTHVIKGSSYLSFNLSELGISYRDDSEKGQKDIGFRVARWIY